MKCFQCSAPLNETARFCSRCGADQGFSAELIARGAAGDQTALTELYNKTYDNVYYTVKALIRDEDTALDILQDSYLKAFRNLNTLKEPEKFRAWIKRIGHNNAVDYLRKAKPMMFSSMPTDDDGAEIEFEDTNAANLPDVVIDQQETARLMAEIIDTLPEDQRVVISMYYYEGSSVKQIAEELGITENTVKSRLSYGRKKIETKVLDLEKKGTKLLRSGADPVPAPTAPLLGRLRGKIIALRAIQYSRRDRRVICFIRFVRLLDGVQYRSRLGTECVCRKTDAGSGRKLRIRCASGSGLSRAGSAFKRYAGAERELHFLFPAKTAAGASAPCAATSLSPAVSAAAVSTGTVSTAKPL